MDKQSLNRLVGRRVCKLDIYDDPVATPVTESTVEVVYI